MGGLLCECYVLWPQMPFAQLAKYVIPVVITVRACFTTSWFYNIYCDWYMLRQVGLFGQNEPIYPHLSDKLSETPQWVVKYDLKRINGYLISSQV